MKLLIEAFTKFVCGLLMVGLLIFLPAGTFAYTYGWLLIGLLFGPMPGGPPLPGPLPGPPMGGIPGLPCEAEELYCF